ncbi:DUF47 domain-containing protein [Clostridium sp. 19966]|uniref:DUF47 domain-containing protein n=1 Tax=Clostridium sp. 19966 TaxID=2768166 RepID=UPI0028DF852D|nr:DUF47 domain-containing protein [Clostridium sp. 19966]MDT8718079.1 DUF47 domain-containing protein [Clostridium sp. 19966]
MFNLSPKNDKFFDMFIQYSEIIHESTTMLEAFVKNPSDAEQKFNEIKNIEHKGDEMLHSIFTELNNSFITPIDREDIFDIGKAMDDIIDYAEATASRFLIFNLDETKEDAVKMAELICKSTEKLIELLKEFKNMKNNKNLSARIMDVNALENDGDVLYRKAIKKLFSDKNDTLDIITWKEVYESMEDVLDATEDVANIIEGVVMKHA